MKAVRLSDNAQKAVREVVKAGQFKSVEDAVDYLLLNNTSVGIPVEGLGMVDYSAALDGLNTTQEDWITYFNSERKKMISAPDVYRILETGDKRLFESIQSSLFHGGIVTSTAIVYLPNTLDAVVVHDYKSEVVEPKVTKIKVPHHSFRAPLEHFLKMDGSVPFLQVLFDTQADGKTIVNTLSRIGDGMYSKKFNIDTEWRTDREGNNLRPMSVSFRGNSRDVDISCYSPMEERAYSSRGVIVPRHRQKK